MLHLLYFIGLIGNTFPIALFVCIVSQFFLFVHPGYINKIKINWFYELLFHWLPIILHRPKRKMRQRSYHLYIL